MDAREKTYAWGDESIRIGADPPVYLLAATIIPSGESLDALTAVKPKGADRLHWRDMTHSLQAKSLEAISRLRQETMLVAGFPLPKKKQERGRRKCLERLLPELESRGISILVLESRNAPKDKQDIELLLSMRRKGSIGSIDIIHKKAANEPQLWIPDQILGAYGDALCDASGVSYWRNPWSKIERRVSVLKTKI